MNPPHVPTTLAEKNPPSQIASVPSSFAHTNFINGLRTSVNAPSLDALAEVSAAAKRVLVSSIGWVRLIALGTMTLNTPRTILTYSLKDRRHVTNRLNISTTMPLAHEISTIQKHLCTKSFQYISKMPTRTNHPVGNTNQTIQLHALRSQGTSPPLCLFQHLTTFLAKQRHLWSWSSL